MPPNAEPWTLGWIQTVESCATWITYRDDTWDNQAKLTTTMPRMRDCDEAYPWYDTHSTGSLIPGDVTRVAMDDQPNISYWPIHSGEPEAQSGLKGWTAYASGGTKVFRACLIAVRNATLKALGNDDILPNETAEIVYLYHIRWKVNFAATISGLKDTFPRTATNGAAVISEGVGKGEGYPCLSLATPEEKDEVEDLGASDPVPDTQPARTWRRARPGNLST
ncbi:hypothetical protein [Nonomuraea jabiensis]|uniref:hypothetical protein n=1 Tax=Nonomuraea jabiensis TaxID=882448 RepID=UPI003D72BFBC